MRSIMGWVTAHPSRPAFSIQFDRGDADHRYLYLPGKVNSESEELVTLPCLANATCKFISPPAAANREAVMK